MIRLRGALLVAIALVGAGTFARSAVADQVVARGDERIRTGDVAGALQYYQRAWWIDYGNAQAADRIAFAALENSRVESLERAREFLTQAERAHPGVEPLRFDAGLLELRERRYAAASIDFEGSATDSHDARRIVFAAIAARRAGDMRRSRVLWKRARSADKNALHFQSAVSS